MTEKQNHWIGRLNEPLSHLKLAAKWSFLGGGECRLRAKSGSAKFVCVRSRLEK